MLFRSGVEPVTHGGDTYEPAPIGRKEFETKSEAQRANLEITISLNDPLAQTLMITNGQNRISVTLFERDKDNVVSVSWKGRLLGISPDTGSLTLNCESIFTSLRRPGLRARYQKTCRHPLYGQGCFVDKNAYATVGTLAAITNRIITVSAAAGQTDGYYLGGMVRDPSGALSFITNHVGSQLTLQRIPYTMASAFLSTGSATVVTIYPGCDHTLETCWAKFSNGLNCGCFKWIPSKNPMGGSSIV